MRRCTIYLLWWYSGVKAFMELWGKGATAFIGPEDSCQTEAMMAAAQNLPMVSFVRIFVFVFVLFY